MAERNRLVTVVAAHMSTYFRHMTLPTNDLWDRVFEQNLARLNAELAAYWQSERNAEHPRVVREQTPLRDGSGERKFSRKHTARRRERDSRFRGVTPKSSGPDDPPPPKKIPAPRPPRQPIGATDRYHVLAVRRCQNCGWSVDDGATLHVDHIRPLSKGGTNARENLQALCAPCNLGKSDFYEAV